MIKCGLLGEKLGHSYSPQIHAMLGQYEYNLYEKAEADVEKFILSAGWTGLNVTIPYKKAVISYLSELSPEAQKTGSVNTIIRQKDGTMFGDNTDVYGFIKMAEHSGISVDNKKVLVLGSGGASAAVVTALLKMHAQPVVISRKGENNYDNLDRHYDAEVIVNTTPLGMYPDTGVSPVDLSVFKKLSGVMDVIYNPARTAFLLQAEELGIPFENGLYMLAAQAQRSAELFTGHSIPNSEIDRVFNEVSFSSLNIILVGMPGSGKSTIAGRLGEITGRRILDTDDEITKRSGSSPEEIIRQRGEYEFRKIENSVLKDIGKQTGLIIAAGGGVVVKEENYNLLHQNGIIVWLQRELDKLAYANRPILQAQGAKRLYRKREALYRRFSDIAVKVNGNEEDTALAILNEINLWREK